MLTDRPPRKSALLAQYLDSDRLATIELPGDASLRTAAQKVELALRESGDELRAGARRAQLRDACGGFVIAAADFYRVRHPQVTALAARPLRVREGGWALELFGDYSVDRMVIRIWTRTAVRKQVTSPGTFLSTLCHEFCHHLDCRLFGFRASPHTRGFYQRTAALYHHARGTPEKRLVWIRAPGGRWRIDWSRMSRGPVRAALNDRAATAR